MGLAVERETEECVSVCIVALQLVQIGMLPAKLIEQLERAGDGEIPVSPRPLGIMSSL